MHLLLIEMKLLSVVEVVDDVNECHSLLVELKIDHSRFVRRLNIGVQANVLK